MKTFLHTILATAVMCGTAMTPLLAQLGTPVASGPRTLQVRPGDNLQTALNNALPGDTIVLDAGGTWIGNFTLPPKTGSSYITVTSSRLAALSAGKRVRPSDSVHMARILSRNNLGAITAAPGSHHWRLVGLELSTVEGVHSTGIARLGDGTAPSVQLIPRDIEVDRCYIHGDPRVGGRRGIAANAQGIRITNSYISDWKAYGVDTQAIACWQCTDVLIENNYLEASGENVIFTSNSNLPVIPSRIVVRRNHLKKPLSWLMGTDVHPSGQKWTVKNLFELKSGIDVLVERNVLENSWASGQIGYVFAIKAQRNEGINIPRTENVVIQDNLCIGGTTGVSVLGFDASSGGVVRSLAVRRNAFIDMGPKWGASSTLVRVVTGPVHDFIVEENTFRGESINAAMSVSGGPSTGFRLTRNLLVYGTYGIKGEATAAGIATMNKFFVYPTYGLNVFVSDKNYSSTHPGNLFVPSIAFASDGYTQYQYPYGVSGSMLNSLIQDVRN